VCFACKPTRIAAEKPCMEEPIAPSQSISWKSWTQVTPLPKHKVVNVYLTTLKQQNWTRPIGRGAAAGWLSLWRQKETHPSRQVHHDLPSSIILSSHSSSTCPLSVTPLPFHGASTPLPRTRTAILSAPAN
jgi:hypothetical protein